MKTTGTQKLLGSFILLALGTGCSAKSPFKDIPLPPTEITYKYECSSGLNEIGIRDLNGFVNVYKNDTKLYENHHGLALSFFFKNVEPTPGDDRLTGSAISANTPDDALEDYALELEIDFTTGILAVEEERYTRPNPDAPWTSASKTVILNGTNCVKI